MTSFYGGSGGLIFESKPQPGAMIFKGMIGSVDDGATVVTLPSNHTAGWTYLVVTAGTYAGEECEIGDFIVCTIDGDISSDLDWKIVQKNVFGPTLPKINTGDAGKAIIIKQDETGYEYAGPYAPINVQTELEDIRIGEDGTQYSKAGNAVRAQRNKSKQEISQIIQDLDTSNLIKEVTKTIITSTDEWNNSIEFRHIWYPFTAKQNYTIESVSFKAFVNNAYLDNSNNFHCELLQDNGTTIIAESSSSYDWINNSTLVGFSFNLNGNVSKNKSYYLHIYCLTRSFSYVPNGYKTKYEDEYILAETPAIVGRNSTDSFNPSLTNDTMHLSVSLKINGKIIQDFNEIKDNLAKVEEDLTKLDNITPVKIYVSTDGSDSTGDGTENNPYATIFFANESITDSSVNKPYTIIVKKGTYTDLQTKYSGDSTTGSYKGVNVKDHVYIESEDPEHPELTVLEWDGFTGFDELNFTEAIRTDMCIFHFNGRKASRQWASGLKGFTLKGSNTRYLLHFEANSDQVVKIENCIFDWNGTPKGIYHTIPTVGMGGSYNQNITFIHCKFLNSESTAGVQWHDNPYPYSDRFLYNGANIKFINCYFDRLDIQMRSTEKSRDMPFSLTIESCGGIRKAVFSKGGSATNNYWRGTVINSIIEGDLISNATNDTNEVTPFISKIDL